MSYDSLPNSSAPSSHKATSSDMAAIINLTNTLVGAGILAMPFALNQNGVFLGVLTIVFAGFTAGLGLYLQGLTAQFVKPGNASFFQIATKTYPALSVVFDLAIAVKCFGVGVSYLIIIAELMPQILGSAAVEGIHRAVWVIIALVLSGPLAYAKKLDSLKYTSVIALLAVGYLVIIVVYQFLFWPVDEGLKGEVDIWTPKSFLAVLKTLPVFVFAFTCHQNMYSALNEIPERKEKNVRKIVVLSIFPATVFYIIVGLAGYLTFGGKVGGNIIAMYPYSIKTVIGQIAIVILVLFSYPLQVHPCRASIRNIVHWIKARNTPISTDSEYRVLEEELEQGEDIAHANSPGIPHGHDSHHILITSAIILASFLLAWRVQSLEIMLAFVGSTGSTSISFILPGLFAYKLLTLQRDEKINPKFNQDFYGYDEGLDKFSLQDQILRWVAVLLFFWGLLVLIVCFGINIVTFA